MCLYGLTTRVVTTWLLPVSLLAEASAAVPGDAAAEQGQAASAAGAAQPGSRRKGEVDVSRMTPGQLRAYLDRQKDLFAAPQSALDR